MYTADSKTAAQIANNFTYHAPLHNQPERYTSIRGDAASFAGMLSVFCPPSRELSLALTKLEEVVFWANAAIARNEKEAAVDAPVA